MAPPRRPVYGVPVTTRTRRLIVTGALLLMLVVAVLGAMGGVVVR